MHPQTVFQDLKHALSGITWNIIFYLVNSSAALNAGLKKKGISHRPGQVDFPFSFSLA